MDESEKPAPSRTRRTLGMRSLIPFLALAALPPGGMMAESDEMRLPPPPPPRVRQAPPETDEQRRRREEHYEEHRRQQLAGNAKFQAAEAKRQRKGAALTKGQKKPRAERP